MWPYGSRSFLASAITETDAVNQFSQCQGRITAAVSLVMTGDVFVYQLRGSLHKVWSNMKEHDLKKKIPTRHDSRPVGVLNA